MYLCVYVCVYVCDALLCCGIRGVAEIEGSLRVRVGVGFAWFEGVLAKFTERHTVRVVVRSLSFVCVCVCVWVFVCVWRATMLRDPKGMWSLRVRVVVGFAWL